MRVFLACRLGGAVAAQLETALRPLHSEVAAARFRWIAAENYHVTLRFFGTLTERAVSDVCRLIEPVAASVRRPIACRVTAPLALPSWSRPAVLTLELDSDGALERLATACDAVIAPRYGAADHPFRAHLTVARCRRPRRMMPPAAAVQFEFDMATCGIYCSTLAPNGARYDALCEFEFASPK